MNKKKKIIRAVPVLLALWVLWVCCPGAAAHAGDGLSEWLPENMEVHGFLETRAGCRTGDDTDEEDLSVMDTRLQVEVFAYTDSMDFKYKGDVWGDGITDKFEYDTREAWFFTRALGGTDLKIGRQVLTWGTGDLVFLNDLFPKDWQSFFIGRDDEYLKAPSDAVKCSFFTDIASIDLVYTPQFDPDQYITGEYISHWNGEFQQVTGQNRTIVADQPDRWFRDHEIALRVYQNISNYEYALYGYSGFWKTPTGKDAGGRRTFAELNVYGASIRGQVGAGIGNIEVAWYDSRDDTDGSDPRVDNSQMRYLVGYAQDVAPDFNVSLQYYVEQILDYSAYEDNLTSGHAKDRVRHVVTFQLTKLLMHQTLTLSLSGYVSPSDQDAYLRPKIMYQYTDNLVLETGANVFFGQDTHTFFSQFENNTSIFAAVRYHF